MNRIGNGIYSVGALNPAMRVFDIVMATDYGTSYNSYLVEGSEKTALIDVCHKSFYKVYLENIKEVCDPKKIDYIILNHNEPDHTGALAMLLEELGDVTIFTSQAGSIYIKAITNRNDLTIKVVKDGDTLDLGGKTLQFISAPFLHWPDSIFTYLPQEKMVFTCDFLGAHYAEPYLYDTNMAYPEKYKKAMEGYYQAIFGPFPKYVAAGLEKLSKLDYDRVLVSHGPVLTKGGMLDYTLAKYKEWSTPELREKKHIPVFYTSAYGNTRKLAQSVAKGILEELDAQVEVYDIIEHPMAQMWAALNDADAFAVGAPTINRDTVPPSWQLLAGIDAVNCAKKPCAVFGSYGWSGEGVPNVAARLTSLKCTVIGDALKVNFVPTPEDLERAMDLGRQLAQALK